MQFIHPNSLTVKFFAIINQALICYSKWISKKGRQKWYDRLYWTLQCTCPKELKWFKRYISLICSCFGWMSRTQLKRDCMKPVWAWVLQNSLEYNEWFMVSVLEMRKSTRMHMLYICRYVQMGLSRSAKGWLQKQIYYLRCIASFVLSRCLKYWIANISQTQTPDPNDTESNSSIGIKILMYGGLIYAYILHYYF